MRIAARDRTFTQPLNWTIAFFLGLCHVGAIAAFFFFTWQGLALFFFMWWLSGSPGIGMGYHRLLTHRGYKCPKWVEYSLTVCATLCLQGGPIGWVATHRIHHQNSDQEGDPHTPHDGGFWAHMGWIITGTANHNRTTELLPYVPDLRKDKFHLWISEWHWVPLVALAATVLLVGGLTFGWAVGWSCLLWGIFLHIVVGSHATYFVNSATHMWGSQRFQTGDDSTNNFWIAMVTWGEGWHNNHHAQPQSARHGLAWYEFDLNWYGISALRKLGLAWDVKLPRHKSDAPSQPSPAEAPADLAEVAHASGD
jgi:stearoyl-CoA desaturase (delta-9 desaturase)